MLQTAPPHYTVLKVLQSQKIWRPTLDLIKPFRLRAQSLKFLSQFKGLLLFQGPEPLKKTLNIGDSM
jgi:hypothetical protein